VLKKENILLVDDDVHILELLQRHLKAMDYHTFRAVSVKEALSILKDTPIDLLITDINMPGIDGIQLVKYVAEHYPQMPKLVVTGFPSVADALSVIKSGATDYLTKPFTKSELETAVKKSLALYERTSKKEKTSNGKGYAGMIGESVIFKNVTEIIDRVKDNRATVLVRGESGTGKELVARAIHYSGKYARAPFIAVNCGAIPENLLEAELFGHTKGAFTGATEQRNGFFQAAHGGTLFLDEIGNAPLSVQVKLLRALQEKEVTKVGSQKPEAVDVRVIAATNTDLEEAIAKKAFREDLFYRLTVVTLTVPSLRERVADIPLLVERFLEKYGLEYKDRFVRMAPEALAVLERHPWPGNVRELENVVQRAIIMSDREVGLAHLPDALKYKIKFQKEGFISLRDKEKEYIQEVLLAMGGNKTKAAGILGIDRKTLREKLKQDRGNSPQPG
jgi:DNA-binding NtrC family response regulator